jgi:hypothetical protein
VGFSSLPASFPLAPFREDTRAGIAHAHPALSSSISGRNASLPNGARGDSDGISDVCVHGRMEHALADIRNERMLSEAPLQKRRLRQGQLEQATPIGPSTCLIIRNGAPHVDAEIDDLLVLDRESDDPWDALVGLRHVVDYGSFPVAITHFQRASEVRQVLDLSAVSANRRRGLVHDARGLFETRQSKLTVRTRLAFVTRATPKG